MMRRGFYLLSVMFVLVIAGCRIGESVWTDDSNNWSRAFHTTKPVNVVVIHSTYWQSAHWTNEFQYFFHIKENAALRQQLVTENDLAKTEGTDAAEASQNFFGEKPNWFLPKPPDKYDLWKFKDKPDQHFKVFVDKDSQDLFVTDFQV